MSANQYPHAGMSRIFRRYRIGCNLVRWWLHQVVQVMISEPWRRRRSWSLNRRLNGTTWRRHSVWDDVSELKRHFAGCGANVIIGNYARFRTAALNLQLESRAVSSCSLYRMVQPHLGFRMSSEWFLKRNFRQNVVKEMNLLLLNKPYIRSLCQSWPIGRLRQLVACFSSPRMPGFNPRTLHVEMFVRKVTLGLG